MFAANRNKICTLSAVAVASSRRRRRRRRKEEEIKFIARNAHSSPLICLEKRYYLRDKRNKVNKNSKKEREIY